MKLKTEINGAATTDCDCAGFSLVELLIAMTITLATLAVGTSLLTGSYNVRNREGQKTDSLADLQRVLNIISREAANSGYALSDNGLVPADCSSTSIRIRANSNPLVDATTADPGEDVKYYLEKVGFESYIVRYDPNDNPSVSVLANRVDGLAIHYFSQKVTYSASGCDISNPSSPEVGDVTQAKYLVIVACVKLPAVGSPGSTGYAPATTVTLASDVALRNANIDTY